MFEHGDPLWPSGHAGMLSSVYIHRNGPDGQPCWAAGAYIVSMCVRNPSGPIHRSFRVRARDSVAISFGRLSFWLKSLPTEEFQRVLIHRPEAIQSILPVAKGNQSAKWVSILEQSYSVPLVCVAACLVGVRPFCSTVKSKEPRSAENKTSLQSCYLWWVPQM